MAWDMAGLLRWDVDFARGLDAGDRYAIVFERFLGENGEVRYGRLLAAELQVSGRPVSIYAFDAPDGRIVYFDGEGRSLERSYLSAPVDFQRISSGFSRSRYHPVLHRWRKHEGIDYAADPGTPVRTIADGVVIRAGWSGGYGRMVEIRHANGVVTRYGHLSAIAAGLQPRMSVPQGAIIGAVGFIRSRHRAAPSLRAARQRCRHRSAVPPEGRRQADRRRMIASPSPSSARSSAA